MYIKVQEIVGQLGAINEEKERANSKAVDFRRKNNKQVCLPKLNFQHFNSPKLC